MTLLPAGSVDSTTWSFHEPVAVPLPSLVTFQLAVTLNCPAWMLAGGVMLASSRSGMEAVAMVMVWAAMFRPVADAEIVTGPAVAPLGTPMMNEADVAPAGMMTELGMVASPVLLLASDTVRFEARGVLPSDTVAVAWPAATPMKVGAVMDSEGPLVLSTLRVVLAWPVLIG